MSSQPTPGELFAPIEPYASGMLDVSDGSRNEPTRHAREAFPRYLEFAIASGER